MTGGAAVEDERTAVGDGVAADGRALAGNGVPRSGGGTADGRAPSGDSATAPDGAPAHAEPAAGGGDGLRAPIEAVMMVAAEPVPASDIADALGVDQEEADGALRALARSYREEGRGFELREADSWWARRRPACPRRRWRRSRSSPTASPSPAPASPGCAGSASTPSCGPSWPAD